MLLADNSARERKFGRKASAIAVAIIVHLAILFVAALYTIFSPSAKEPAIVAQIISPQKEETKLEMKKREVVKQAKEVSASASASPIAKLIRANTTAKIAAPEVLRFSDGPIGLGEGDFGSGFGDGSGGGGGMGSGSTMFGSNSATGLIGQFYDLKQTPDRKPSRINPTQPPGFGEAINTGIRRRLTERAFSDYFKAPVKLGFNFLAVPYVSADEGPAAFQVEKEVQPKGWLVHYKGTIIPPEPGKWRFVGYFDDALIVLINGRVVFEGSWQVFVTERDARNTFGGPALSGPHSAVAGKWVDLSGPAEIDIIIGERPGGFVGGALMVQHEGTDYSKRKDGSPILPVFATMPLSAKDQKRLRDFPYEFARTTPVFRTSGAAF